MPLGRRAEVGRAESARLRRRSAKATMLRRRPAEATRLLRIAVLWRSAEAAGLLPVTSIGDVGVGERRSVARRGFRSTVPALRSAEAPVLRRRTTKAAGLLSVAAAVLVVREGHRVERHGVTVRAVALSRRDVVTHLATGGRLARRSAVRTGRRAESALCPGREAPLRRGAEAGGDHGYAADVAELVRRLRDRAALRTRIHRSVVSKRGRLLRRASEAYRTTSEMPNA